MEEMKNNFLTFKVGHQWYGVPVSQVIEVFRFMALTELPVTTPDVLGLMSVRNTVMPVIDLRILFELPDSRLRLDTPIIAIQTEQGALGLVIDDVDNVESVADAQLAAYDGGDSPYISKVARQADRLILLLDTPRIRNRAQLPEEISLAE